MNVVEEEQVELAEEVVIAYQEQARTFLEDHLAKFGISPEVHKVTVYPTAATTTITGLFGMNVKCNMKFAEGNFYFQGHGSGCVGAYAGAGAGAFSRDPNTLVGDTLTCNVVAAVTQVVLTFIYQGVPVGVINFAGTPSLAGLGGVTGTFTRV